jgi:hypothetical protein
LVWICIGGCRLARRARVSGAAADDQRLLRRMSIAVAIWGLCYAVYRGYYAAGGTGFLPGRPADLAQFRLINVAGAAILILAAVLPIAMLLLWRGRGRGLCCWRCAG